MKIQYISSLGSFCQTAFFLKRNNLKNESYPFDWLCSDLNIVISCIEDGFVKFLDKAEYIDIGENRAAHKSYHPTMFWHYSPLNDIHYDYYVRCVDRFKQLLKQKESKLFIVMFKNDLNGTNCLTDEFKNDVIAFNNRFKLYTDNYTLLCIYHHTSNDKDIIKNQQYDFSTYENIDFLDIQTISESDGVKFIDENDNKFMDYVIKNRYEFTL